MNGVIKSRSQIYCCQTLSLTQTTQVMLLEELEFSPETEAMWQTLCTVAMQEFKLVNPYYLKP